MSKTPTRPGRRPTCPGGSAALGATTQTPYASREPSRRGRHSHTGSRPRKSAPLGQADVAQGTPARWPQHRPDSGFALIVGLLLLVVMSVIGVAMMSVTRMETLMAGGAREANIAFQATEAGLREAEIVIALSVKSIATMGDGWLRLTETPEPLEPDFFEAATWDIDHSEFDGDSAPVNVAYPELGTLGARYQPRYVIKHVGNVTDDATEKQAIAIVGYQQGGAVPPTSIFRITARGTSRDGSAETILQSYFGKVYQ